MDPIVYMMLCSTVEAAASVLMGLSLFALAVVEIRREFKRGTSKPRRVKGAGKPGTW